VIPVIASSGRSFKGAALYYLQDKDTYTRERVEWTHVENLPTMDPDKAVKVMAWTAIHQAELKQQAGIKATGRKLEKPVFTFSISWHPEENPDKDHMLKTAQAAVKELGLSEHQILYVSHNDEPQKHVHIIVNRVHPVNGKAATLSKSKERLSRWAHEYEKKHGKIYCRQREENTRKREQGSRKKKYCDPVIEQAWKRSDSGKAFAAALNEHGYYLAKGRSRIVIIDAYGKAHNPVRLLEGVKAKDFKTRVQDIDLNQLPQADRLQKEIKEQNRQAYHESRNYDWWAAQSLNETQDRHLDERANLYDQHHRKIEKTKDELTEYYKPDELKAEINRLKKSLENPSIWDRISGKAARDRQTLETLEKNLENIEQRTGEKIGQLEHERDQALEQQQRRHKEEKERVYKRVQKGKPQNYREENDPTQEHTPKQEQRIEEFRDKLKQKRSERRHKRSRGPGW